MDQALVEYSCIAPPLLWQQIVMYEKQVWHDSFVASGPGMKQGRQPNFLITLTPHMDLAEG